MSHRKLVCNVLVVGGGPVGSSVAFHLAKAGVNNVVVLEKDLCFRSASAMLSAGGIRQQFSVPENIKMSMYGAEFLKNPQQLAVDGEVPDLQFHENGYLFLTGDKSKHIMLENYKTQRECGADWMKLLNKEEMTKKFPWLNLGDFEGSSDLVMGSFGEKNEGYFDPWLFVNALKQKNISLGVKYIEGYVSAPPTLSPLSPTSPLTHTITSLKISSPASSTHNPNPIDEISAAQVVNCAGAWSGSFLSLLTSNHPSSQSFFPLPVFPRKRCIFSFHCKSHSHAVPPARTPLTIDPSGVYFRPEGGGVQAAAGKEGGDGKDTGGRFICGLSPPEDQDPNILPSQEAAALQSPDHALFEEQIWPILAQRVPAFGELKLTGAWAGFYDYNVFDQNAIIGFHPEIRNLTVCTGFSGHGLQQSPAAGRAIAELLTQGRYETLDLSKWGLERIMDKKPVYETGIV